MSECLRRKGQITRLVIEAISNSHDDGISDNIIAAVLGLAIYEVGYAQVLWWKPTKRFAHLQIRNDDQQAYEIHMAGLTQMIKKRGGLQSLGMNGFLADMVVG